MPDYNALRVELHSGMTNGVGADHGMLLDVGGHMRVENACWIYLYSHYTNGGSPKFEVGDLTVADGGAFTANGSGFSGGLYALGGYNAKGFGPGGSPGGTTFWQSGFPVPSPIPVSHRRAIYIWRC